MIATVTLNPSVDISYFIDHFALDTVHRCRTYVKTAGGKGLNVAKVLKQLGHNVLATGFLGGSTGQFIQQELSRLDIHADFVDIAESTRNCIAILSAGKQTEIVENGPQIRTMEAERLLTRLQDVLGRKPIKVLSISGSIPAGIQPSYYREIIHLAHHYHVPVVLDTSGSALKQSLTAAPNLIKPNITELEALLDTKITSEVDLVEKLKGLSDEHQIPMIVTSLGKDGAVALYNMVPYKVTIPQVAAVNPVGSGDALVAGLVSAMAEQQPIGEMLRKGNTCGVLNAMNLETGAIQLDDYDTVYKAITVKRITT